MTDIFNFVKLVFTSDFNITYNKILHSDLYYQLYTSLFSFDNHFISLFNYFTSGAEYYLNFLLNFVYAFEGYLYDFGTYIYSFEFIKKII